jgi:hypothetical protein
LYCPFKIGEAKRKKIRKSKGNAKLGTGKGVGGRYCHAGRRTLANENESKVMACGRRER